MAETPPASPTPPTVTDRRPIPRGVLPRGAQTWIMAAIAVGMLVIMLVVGRPEPPARTKATPATAQAPTADRVRDYQEQLRALEAQALRETQTVASEPAPAAVAYDEPPSAAAHDPVKAERKRREYESLFASNVVLSRRSEDERPDAGRTAGRSGELLGESPASPSIDDIAEAAVRATRKVAGAASEPAEGPEVPVPSATAQRSTTSERDSNTPERTKAINAAGPLHRILEGTLIDAVLTNRLDGSAAAPVNCLVTNPVYSHSGHHVLIPAGARILGHTRPVQGLGETRLAVTFHRLLMPDGRTYRLDEFTGLNQIGDAGLRDRVNHHYLATFGAAAAVGLISGLAQSLGSLGLGLGDGDRAVIIAGGVGDATSQATIEVMNRFLNRLPTVTIREGHRVKVY
ncbi:MAG: TrbI/VirB10 family protein, partial [Vicinamibacteraceae bacterium]